jgi:isocitrate/isopropylmalate dehydrogenase
MAHKILLLEDEGGAEINEAIRALLDRLEQTKGLGFQCNTAPVGRCSWAAERTVLPEKTAEMIRESEAALLVSVVSSPAEAERSSMGELRKRLDLFAEIRHIRRWPGLWAAAPDLDMIFIRENLEGFLPDRNLFKGNGEFMPNEDTVISLRVLNRGVCGRIASFAFDYAARRGRKTITVAHKSNVMRMGCGFFLSIAAETAKYYPNIRLTDSLADGLAYDLICRPEAHDVILATNLFGDLLSDEASALTAAPSVGINIGPGAMLITPVQHNRTSTGTEIGCRAVACVAGLLREINETPAATALESALTRVVIEERNATRITAADVVGRVRAYLQ